MPEDVQIKGVRPIFYKESLSQVLHIKTSVGYTIGLKYLLGRRCIVFAGLLTVFNRSGNRGPLIPFLTLISDQIPRTTHLVGISSPSLWRAYQGPDIHRFEFRLLSDKSDIESSNSSSEVSQFGRF